MKNLCTILFLIILMNTHLNAQWVTNGTKISDSHANSHHYKPYNVANQDKGMYISWCRAKDTGNSVYLSCYEWDGTLSEGWQPYGNMLGDVTDFYAPYLINSEDNGVIVAWYGTAPGTNNEEIYIQKFSKQGIALWNGGNPLKVSQDTIYHNKYPVLVSDKKNGVYITWTRYDLSVSASSPDIMLQRLNESGEVYDGWTAQGVEVAATPSIREYYPRIALTNDLSGIYVMYSVGLVGNTKLNIQFINTLDGTFATGWETPLTLSEGPYVEGSILKNQFLFCDSLNNAIAFWIEWRFTDNGEVYMQQVTPQKTILLSNSGKRIGGYAQEGAGYLEVVENEQKEYLAAFNDYHQMYDVDALKVTADGWKSWENTTVTTNAASAYPKPVSDGNGGMFVFYKNTSTNKLLALALDSTGNIYPDWTSPSSFGNIGNYSGFFPNYDFYPVATDSAKAMVAWTKNVSGYYDIYICNLWSNGVNCTDSILSVDDNSSSDNFAFYPNPVKDFLTLEVPENISRNLLLNIFDISGNLIETLQLDAISDNKINIYNLRSGAYFIEILDAKKNCYFRNKVIKL